MSGALAKQEPRIWLCVENDRPAPGPYATRAFSVDLRKEWRIVQAVRHVVGRFTYYRTEFHEASAVYLEPPYRRFPTHMRWNLDEAGEPQLELVFRHKGRTARLDTWIAAPPYDCVGDPLKTC